MRLVRRRLYPMWPAVVVPVVVVVVMTAVLDLLPVPEAHPFHPNVGLVVLSSALVAVW